MVGSLSAAPDRVLDSIFVFCDYSELFASSHVCTAWRHRTSSSVMWRRVAREDLRRARETECQVVATPIQKRAGLSSSLNTAHLYTVEVRVRQRQCGSNEYGGGNGGYGYGDHRRSANNGPSYAQNLPLYTFGMDSTSVARNYGSGGGGELEHSPSSTCFTAMVSTTQVRRICMQYLRPLRFTAGDAIASALRRANAKAAHAAASSSTDSGNGEHEKEEVLPLWEDASMIRHGVLLCDPRDPCTLCYYAATMYRPWCTVLMDRFVIDNALLKDFIEHSSDAAACIDLAFRVEELPVVRNDPRDPSRLVRPGLPVSIRIGVIEVSQLGAYRRGLHQVIGGMVFYSHSGAASADDGGSASANDSSDCYGERHGAHPNNTDMQDYAWGALDAGFNTATRRGGGGNGSSGVSWSYTGGGGPTRNDDDDPNSAANAEAEVAAWLRASVQESTQPSQDKIGAAKKSPYSAVATGQSKPLEFWAQEAETRPSRLARALAGDADVPDDQGDCAHVLGDTPDSFGYDIEGNFLSEGSCYPLGAPLLNGDVVHLQFLHDEDVIVLTRNRERLGTLVADAFSEGQRWCVAVSLQNCGVRFIPPSLS
ncbi:hypothetical protein ABL78_7842 [Leptomonas seymouri]|uniref:F-box domain-containing protein n=1 Tax=Leptomonas seymouri TaxID=5684 RepID=A0A0N1HTF6_LEPSE|nr:hypothetical protein ABL78_7842 [Leptomonas seymouri]|eukprot:KPI83132.1 hypothetical protein ABL78_7842 [Leptomonas seymouri]